MPRLAFSTPRLRVLPIQDALANPRGFNAELSQILTPPVLAPLPPSLQLKGRSITEWIATQSANSDVLVIRDRDKTALIGLMLLHIEPAATPDCHLGYLIAETNWGQGFATELLEGFIAFCRANFPAIKLLAGVDADNPASARVLKKAGFTAQPNPQSPTGTLFQLQLP
tara:strand:- start:1296 stop:1802 length:507 start_codon:yes stop_codon:yes gene_type:complete